MPTTIKAKSSNDLKLPSIFQSTRVSSQMRRDQREIRTTTMRFTTVAILLLAASLAHAKGPKKPNPAAAKKGPNPNSLNKGPNPNSLKNDNEKRGPNPNSLKNENKGSGNNNAGGNREEIEEIQEEIAEELVDVGKKLQKEAEKERGNSAAAKANQLRGSPSQGREKVASFKSAPSEPSPESEASVEYDENGIPVPPKGPPVKGEANYDKKVLQYDKKLNKFKAAYDAYTAGEVATTP